MSSQLKQAIYSTFGSSMRLYTVVPCFDKTFGASASSAWSDLDEPKKHFAIWERSEESDWRLMFECDVTTDADDEFEALNLLFASHEIPLDIRQELLYGPQAPVVR